MTIETYIALIVFLPLISSILVGLNTRWMSAGVAQAITCTGIVIAAIASAGVFLEFWPVVQEGGWQARYGEDGLVYKLTLMHWIHSGDFAVDWVLRVDVLTATMFVVVTFVSAVVHLYSIGYMSHDPHPQRFFAYLSLFTFFMLMLVSADNFVQLFLGWEGVGLCSYLLIGFWYHKASASAASIKAFLVNRVGDIGLALGIFTIFIVFGTLSFDVVFAQAEAEMAATFHFLGAEVHTLSLICLLLFIGCMGKSAQLGLHTWLPDAMEGPTPVSALIHAATMVTAGVFLLVRCSPLFEFAPNVLEVVAFVGALTAFFAATIGLTQFDIKRVIAYSTCSQLGYMFFACGVGAYAAAMFHLFTHAFFKALLFLGAGSVIHGMSDEQDMRNMGGIARKMPVTCAFMWLGSLALAGLPFFAGYYSKDIILESAYVAGGIGRFAFILGVLAALMTAFYSWRLIFMTFYGKPRASQTVMHHVHESPGIMLWPLLVLVAGTLFAGAMGANVLHMVSGDATFWQATIASHEIIHDAHHHIPLGIKWMPTILAVLGIALAYVFYIRETELPAIWANRLPAVHRFIYNKWYVDELYTMLFVRPSFALGKRLWHFWDARIIDGMGPNGVAAFSWLAGGRLSALQTGYVYHYAFAMLIGVVAILSWVLYGS